MSRSLLSVRDLGVSFPSDRGLVRAVDSVSFDVAGGEVLAIVGESGSGKSITALSVLGLLPPSAHVDHGEIWWRDHNLLQASDAQLRGVRGKEIAMVFQDPLASLNPVHRVGRQVGEVLQLHEGLSRKAALQRVLELFELVGIPEPAHRVDAYPHELSGGMRQRVMIAMALACRPSLLIADEPTTALDVTVQAQVLELLLSLRDEIGVAILLITHDLGVVANAADEVIVMYSGRVAERGSVDDVFTSSAHPYTQALLTSLPRLDDDATTTLAAIPGNPPTGANRPSGCPFHPRCAYAQDEPCARVVPKLRAIEMERTGIASEMSSHEAACHRIDEISELRR